MASFASMFDSSQPNMLQDNFTSFMPPSRSGFDTTARHEPQHHWDSGATPSIDFIDPTGPPRYDSGAPDHTNPYNNPMFELPHQGPQQAQYLDNFNPVAGERFFHRDAPLMLDSRDFETGSQIQDRRFFDESRLREKESAQESVIGYQLYQTPVEQMHAEIGGGRQLRHVTDNDWTVSGGLPQVQSYDPSFAQPDRRQRQVGLERIDDYMMGANYVRGQRYLDDTNVSSRDMWLQERMQQEAASSSFLPP